MGALEVFHFISYDMKVFYSFYSYTYLHGETSEDCGMSEMTRALDTELEIRSIEFSRLSG